MGRACQATPIGAESACAPVQQRSLTPYPNPARDPPAARCQPAVQLYKQALEGDNSAKQPWAVQLEARAKWDAWEANKGEVAPPCGLLLGSAHRLAVHPRRRRRCHNSSSHSQRPLCLDDRWPPCAGTGKEQDEAMAQYVALLTSVNADWEAHEALSAYEG